jgi:hypothetical protein
MQRELENNKKFTASAPFPGLWPLTREHSFHTFFLQKSRDFDI